MTEKDSKAHMYVVECADGTFYTGYTTDVERRLKTHNSGKGANIPELAYQLNSSTQKPSLASLKPWAPKHALRKKAERKTGLYQRTHGKITVFFLNY